MIETRRLKNVLIFIQTIFIICYFCDIYVTLCDIYSKYARVIPLKDNEGITITNGFQKTLKEYNRKRNKISVDKVNLQQINEKMVKKWYRNGIEKNGIEMYSTHNEQKSIIAEIFIRTLENKISKYLNSVSESVYFDKIDDVVNKYKIHIITN